MEPIMTKRKHRIEYQVIYGNESQEEKKFTNVRNLKLFLNELLLIGFEPYLYISIFTYKKGKTYQNNYEIEYGESYAILDIFAVYERKDK